jgi:hypothetical protein
MHLASSERKISITRERNSRVRNNAYLLLLATMAASRINLHRFAFCRSTQFRRLAPLEMSLRGRGAATEGNAKSLLHYSRLTDPALARSVSPCHHLPDRRHRCKQQ